MRGADAAAERQAKAIRYRNVVEGIPHKGELRDVAIGVEARAIDERAFGVVLPIGILKLEAKTVGPFPADGGAKKAVIPEPESAPIAGKIGQTPPDVVGMAPARFEPEIRAVRGQSRSAKRHKCCARKSDCFQFHCYPSGRMTRPRPIRNAGPHRTGSGPEYAGEADGFHARRKVSHARNRFFLCVAWRSQTLGESLT
jgi:hypothetical protein